MIKKAMLEKSERKRKLAAESNGFGIYVNEVRCGKEYFDKVGYFDSKVRKWRIDSKGGLWALLHDGTLAISTAVG